MNNNSFKIYIDDLKDNVKKELIEYLGGENGNYDVIPLIEVHKEDSEEE